MSCPPSTLNWVRQYGSDSGTCCMHLGVYSYSGQGMLTSSEFGGQSYAGLQVWHAVCVLYALTWPGEGSAGL